MVVAPGGGVVPCAPCVVVVTCGGTVVVGPAVVPVVVVVPGAVVPVVVVVPAHVQFPGGQVVSEFDQQDALPPSVVEISHLLFVEE